MDIEQADRNRIVVRGAVLGEKRILVLTDSDFAGETAGAENAPVAWEVDLPRGSHGREMEETRRVNPVLCTLRSLCLGC